MNNETLIQELADLVRRAEANDPTALPTIRKILDANPAIWEQVGDLAKHAELLMVDLAAGKNIVLKEALTRKLSGLKDELAAGPISPLEKLLIDRIATCWLQTAQADVAAAQVQSGTPGAAFHVKRQDRAHHRFLTGVKTLAVVRKLLRPAPAPLEVASRLNDRGSRVTAGRGHDSSRLVGALN